MFHPVKSTSVTCTDFKGCKLIVVSVLFSTTGACADCNITQPCVSVGNVAQLASDLLINTLKMERVGHLYDQCFLPLVCHSAFDHDSRTLSTSAEGTMCTHVCLSHELSYFSVCK